MLSWIRTPLHTRRVAKCWTSFCYLTASWPLLSGTTFEIVDVMFRCFDVFTIFVILLFLISYFCISVDQQPCVESKEFGVYCSWNSDDFRFKKRIHAIFGPSCSWCFQDLQGIPINTNSCVVFIYWDRPRVWLVSLDLPPLALRIFQG